MTTTVERLLVELLASTAKYGEEMNLAYRVTQGTLNKIEARFRGTEKNVEASSAKIGRAVKTGLAAIGVGVSINELIDYVDAWRGVENALKTANVPALEYADTIDRLYGQAQVYGVALQAEVDLYASLRRAARDLTSESESLYAVTAAVGASLKIEGRSAEESSGALLQLTQLFRGSTVQAQEYNSLIDQMPSLLQAVADNLDGAGGSVGRLTQLVKSGEVATKAFFNALVAGSGELKSTAAAAATTFDQAFTKIDNAFLKYIGTADDSRGASQQVIAGLESLAENFGEVADTAIMLAQVIAVGLVGRAFANTVLYIPIMIAAFRLLQIGAVAAAKGADVATVAFGKASAAARGFSVVQKGLRYAAITTFAGPLGFAIAGLAETFYLLSTSTDAGAREAERLTEEMYRLGYISAETAGQVAEVSREIDNLTEGQRAQKLRQLADYMDTLKGGSFFGSFFTQSGDLRQLDDILTRADALRIGISSQGLEVDPVDNKALLKISDLARGLDDGEVSASQVMDALEDLKRLDVTAPVDQLIVALERTAELIKGNIRLQQRYSDGVVRGDRQPVLSDELEATAARTRDFLAERDRRAGLSDQARAVEDRAGQIIKEARDAGIIITEAMAMLQATEEVGIEFARKAKAPDVGDFERSSIQIEERIAVMQAEYATLQQINPLVEDYGYQLDRARIAAELEADARRENLELTPELAASIDDLADRYARAAAEIARVAESQDEYRRQMEELRSLEKDALKGFLSDVKSGTSLVDALANAVGRLSDRLLDFGIDQLFSVLGGAGGSSSFLGSLFRFAKGGVMTSRGSVPLNAYAGGGVADSAQLALFGEGSRPEAFVPLPDGRNIPVKLQIPNAIRSGGGGTTDARVYNIDARGSTMTPDEFRAILDERDRVVTPKVARAAVARSNRLSTNKAFR